MTMNIPDRLEKQLLIATLALLAVWAAVATVPLMSSSPHGMQPSPIPNTTMDSDGVIRLTPEKGCGPQAHVEKHPVYGALCIQDESRWVVAAGSAVAAPEPLCSTADPSNGAVVSCQPGAWRSSRQ